MNGIREMRWLMAGALVLVGALQPLSAGAAAARDGGAADPRLQAMVQRLSLERNQLQQQLRTAEAELSERDGELDEAKAGARKLTGELAGTNRELQAERLRSEALAAQNVELRERLTTLGDRFRSLAETLQAAEQTNDVLTSASQDYAERVAVCETNNENLYTIVGEIADQYGKRGLFRSLREREPFLRLKRTQVENMLEEYRALADDMRLKYDLDGTAAAAAAAATPTSNCSHSETDVS